MEGLENGLQQGMKGIESSKEWQVCLFHTLPIMHLYQNRKPVGLHGHIVFSGWCKRSS